MTRPRRIQLSRAKGWRKPPGAVVVARPSRWGNPYRVGALGLIYAGQVNGTVGRYGDKNVMWTDVQVEAGLSAEQVVALYRHDLQWALNYEPDPGDSEARAEQEELWAALAELAGHDLACWCPPGQPCHADVLLELANPGKAGLPSHPGGTVVAGEGDFHSPLCDEQRRDSDG